MYVQRNIGARSFSHCCSGKAMNITYVSVCVSLPTKNEHAPNCHLWPPQDLEFFPHYLMNVTIKKKRKYPTEHKMCVLIFYRPYPQHFHFEKKRAIYGKKVQGIMSTEGETLHVSVLPYRCSICPPLVTRQLSTL